MSEQEVITISEKGQIVIPQEIRSTLGIEPRTKFVITEKEGFIIMKKLLLPDIEKEWSNIFKTIKKKNLKITEKDITEEIRAYRKQKNK